MPFAMGVPVIFPVIYPANLSDNFSIFLLLVMNQIEYGFSSYSGGEIAFCEHHSI